MNIGDWHARKLTEHVDRRLDDAHIAILAKVHIDDTQNSDDVECMAEQAFCDYYDEMGWRLLYSGWG